MTSLSDTEYAAAVQRIREFRQQVTEAEQLADAGSLEVAREMARIFDDGRWTSDLPAVKRSHLRGRPVDPLGRSRFATWAREPEHLGGWAPSSTYRFLNAAQVTQLIPHGETIQGATEGTLRPLTSLLAKGKTDDVEPIWETARRRAGGIPTAQQVKAVIKERYPQLTATRRTKADAGTRRDWSDVIFGEFEQHLLSQHRLRDAGMLILRMKEAYDKALAASRGA